MEIIDAPGLDRFEARLDGTLAGYLEYAKHDDGRGEVWSLNHAFTFPEFRGRGIAAEVTRFALEAADAAAVRVRAVCPFVVDYVAAHPGYAHLTTD